MIAKAMFYRILMYINDYSFQIINCIHMLSPERMLKQTSGAFVAFVESLSVSIKKIGELLIDTFVRFQFPKDSRTPKVLETFGV